MTFYRRWAPAADPSAHPQSADRVRSTPAPSRAEVDELLAEFLEADRGSR
jgi:hypothetical protein